MADEDPKSLEETVNAALEADAGSAPDPAPEPQPDPPSDAEAEPASPAQDGRARDEKGRFVAKDGPEGESDAQAEPDPGEQAVQAQDGEGAGEEGQAPEAEAELEPPHQWSAQAQELFRSQPPAVQKYLLERHREMEGDYTRKTQEIAPLRSAYEKWHPYCQQNGARFEQAVDNLMQTEYALRTGTPQQKRDVLLHVARTYGIELTPQTEGAPAEDDDPIAAHPVIRQIATGLQGIQGFLTQQSQTQQRQVVTQSNQALDQFRAEKDASGQPAHPYFDEVIDDMVAQARTDAAMGRAPVLKDLYERAIWANPSVRAKILAAEQHKARKAEDQRKREAAEKARKAGVSITGAPSSTPDKPQSLEDTVAEAMTASA